MAMFPNWACFTQPTLYLDWLCGYKPHVTATILLLVVSSAFPTIAIHSLNRQGDFYLLKAPPTASKSSASLILKSTLEAFLNVTLDTYLLKHLLHNKHVEIMLYLKVGKWGVGVEIELRQQSKFKVNIKQRDWQLSN